MGPKQTFNILPAQKWNKEAMISKWQRIEGTLSYRADLHWRGPLTWDPFSNMFIQDFICCCCSVSQLGKLFRAGNHSNPSQSTKGVPLDLFFFVPGKPPSGAVLRCLSTKWCPNFALWLRLGVHFSISCLCPCYNCTLANDFAQQDHGVSVPARMATPTTPTNIGQKYWPNLWSKRRRGGTEGTFK